MSKGAVRRKSNYTTGKERAMRDAGPGETMRTLLFDEHASGTGSTFSFRQRVSCCDGGCRRDAMRRRPLHDRGICLPLYLGRSGE